LLSLWAGHLALRKKAKGFVYRLEVPVLRFSESKIEAFSTIIAFGGALLAIFASIFGAYGFFKTSINLESPPLWHGILSYAINLSMLMSFIVFLSTYRQSGSLRIRHLFLISIWIFSGFLSGYKAQVLVPIILLSIAAWSTRRLNYIHFTSLILALISAYLVVQPMREIAIYGRGETGADTAFITAISSNVFKSEKIVTIQNQVLKRLDYSETAINTLYAERVGMVEKYKKSLSDQYILLPLLVFIPRFLWPEKPLADMGRQLSIDMDSNSFNSITPSAPVVSYMTGGYFLLIVSNFILGGIITVSGFILL
jgi:hypothetical protein